MPVFVSYSHQDSDFVDRIATQLVLNNIKVWLDRWELHVGDSLLSKVQEGIVGASALLVILSRASTASEWCKKELNSGLMRELDEKRVIVLPVILEDCDIPLFLREKVYADFRRDFDAGLRAILEAVAAISTDSRGRIDTPRWHKDWSIDWGTSDDGHFGMTLTIIEAAYDQPYSILTIIEAFGNDSASAFHARRDRNGEGADARRELVGAIVAAIGEDGTLDFRFSDQFAQRRHFELKGEADRRYSVRTTCRWLGQDTGRDVLYYAGSTLTEIWHHMQEVAFRPRQSKAGN